MVFYGTMIIVSQNIFNYLKENHKNLVIGDNQPYSGRLKNDTLYKHATIMSFKYFNRN